MSTATLPTRPAVPRRAAVVLLVLAVTLLHLLLASRLPESRLGSGAADTRPQRLDVRFVRELAPTAAPTVAPRAPPPAPARRVAAAAPAASSATAPAASSAAEPPPEAQALPDVPAEPALDTPPAMASADASAVAAAEPAASAAAAEPAAPVFEWPPSTRLSYALTGYFRGPVEGQASVEWLRSGARYQVRLDIGVGPSFAPLVSRHVTSDGELTESGLRPRRYDEETRVALREPRRQTIFFDDERIRLPGGKEVPLPPGVQDPASQFVQLTWFFTMNPDWLQRGRRIELPLALPRYVDRWTYEVLESELLATPAGDIPTVHVKPRREPRPGSEITAEMWVAPTLQYLPVRILIHQDAETWIDMRLIKLPQQAAAETVAVPGR